MVRRLVGAGSDRQSSVALVTTRLVLFMFWQRGVGSTPIREVR